MKKQTSKAKGAAIALAVAGLFATVATSSCKSGGDDSSATHGDKRHLKEAHACKAMNSCNGRGGCSTGDNGCAGKNSCKGKGGCATVDKHGCKGMNACKGQGGCKTGDAGCAGKNSCTGKGGCAVPVMH